MLVHWNQLINWSHHNFNVINYFKVKLILFCFRSADRNFVLSDIPFFKKFSDIAVNQQTQGKSVANLLMHQIETSDLDTAFIRFKQIKPRPLSENKNLF